MDIFQQAWANTGRAEGAYSNDPKDPGGETMFGITIRVARAQGYSGPMKDLPQETATRIARAEYWVKPGIDLIAAYSAAIALEIFDTNFNLYSGFAAASLQRSLNALNRNHLDYPDIPVDSRLGSKTFDALAAFLKKRGAGGELVLLRALNALQGAEYIRQAEANRDKEAFLFGWLMQRVKIETPAVDER